MNLNKNFLTEVIKYLISKGVTVHDVLDAFHAQFEYHEQNISRQDELRKPLTDIDLLLCGRSVEESSTLEKPTETLETKTETLETESNTEKATESVTNATALNGNNVTAVILDTPNPNAIHGDKDDYIEKALKKFITSTTGIEFEEPKKDKKPKESKKDYTMADVCFKLNVTTHELKEMISTGEFPQPDCGNKWSVKLLKEKNLI